MLIQFGGKGRRRGIAERGVRSLGVIIIGPGGDLLSRMEAVANALNTRPRKTLGWKTPAEILDQFLAK